jgi:hypothetical protein
VIGASRKLLVSPGRPRRTAAERGARPGGDAAANSTITPNRAPIKENKESKENMAFIPPTAGPNPLSAELAQADQNELEAKAERQAELHQDEDGIPEPGLIRRLWDRARAAISGRNS